MVLDNADDRDTFFAKSTSATADVEPTRPLSDYLPQDSQGLMLITTRDNRMCKRLAGIHASIIVRPMTFSEAEKLLRSQLEEHHAWNDDESRKLITELEYIPLAITQAAAFVSQNSVPLADYLDMFRTDDSEIQKLLSEEDLGDARRDSDSPNSVFRTWKLSFDLISKQKLRAAEMLSLMAVLDRQGIPKSLLQHKTDSDVDVKTALGTLQAFSLITLEDNGMGYQLHRLVQLATRKWLELQGTKAKWQEQALLVLADQFPIGAFENWKICESFLPHAQTVIQYKDILERCSEQYLHLMSNIAFFDMEQGRYEIACINNTAAAELQEKLFGLEHPDTLISMNNLALTYENQGRWDEAEKLHVRVMETRIRILKEDHPDTLISMNNLALTYGIQGRWDEAEKLHVQVMKTKIRVLKEDHPDTLISMNNLAWTYHDQERHSEALALMRKVVNLRTKKIGANHPDTLESIRALEDWTDISDSDDENPEEPDSSLAIEDGNADSG